MTHTHTPSTQKNPLIKAETATLANGMKIIVIPNGAAEIVSIGVVYHVGTADDPVDRVGLSHFMEHMMFKGTKEIPGAEFNKQILKKGGMNNAWTEFDYTFFYTTIARHHLEFILKIEADRMRNLTFTEQEVTSEMGVVLEERLMRIDNNPLGIASERLLRAVHPYHPYGVHPIGFPHHIKNYTFKSVRDHYDAWYRPNNAMLIVVGKATLADVLPLAEKYFGVHRAHEIPKRARIQNPPRDGITTHIMQHNPRNSIIQTNWHFDAPQFKSEQGATLYYPLTVLAYALGGNDVTEFHQTLVEQKKLAIRVTTSYDGNAIDPQGLDISAYIKPDQNVDDVLTEIQAIIQKIHKNGLSDDDLARAKQSLIGTLSFITDGSEGFLQSIVDYLAKGFTIDDLNNWQKHIEQVSQDDIKRAAALLTGDPVVSLEIHPPKQAG